MISEQDIYDQAYADGLNRGHLVATARAESRRELGLPLTATPEYDAWLARIFKRDEKIDFLAAARISYVPVQPA